MLGPSAKAHNPQTVQRDRQTHSPPDHAADGEDVVGRTGVGHPDTLAASLDHLLDRLDECALLLDAKLARRSCAGDYPHPPTIATGPQDAGRYRKAVVSPEERLRLISEAAYYRAERRHFAPSDPLEDWRAAEAEIDARIRG